MLEFIRGMVRPTLTWCGFIAVVVLAAMGRTIPEWLVAQESMMVAWWFSDRMRRENGNASGTTPVVTPTGGTPAGGATTPNGGTTPT